MSNKSSYIRGVRFIDLIKQELKNKTISSYSVIGRIETSRARPLNELKKARLSSKSTIKLHLKKLIFHYTVFNSI